MNTLKKRDTLTDMKLKLTTLYEDLMIADDENGMVINVALEYAKGKEDDAIDLYTRDHAPIKVSGLNEKIKSDHDMNEVLVEFSSGYEEFVKNLNRRAGVLMSRYSEAVELLFMILSLPFPYSSLIYLRYYRRMSVKEIQEQLNLSRSTYYRLSNEAITNLNCLYRNYKSGRGEGT